MLTLTLWRAINRPPPRSPLFRRAYNQNAPSLPLMTLRLPLMELFKNTGLIVMPVVLIIFGAPILALLYYLSLLMAPFLLPLANTIYGLTHANSASGKIAREREQQTYDVFCTVPAGSLGLHWSYSAGWLHYHWWYRYTMLAVLSTGIIASIFGLSPQILFGPGQPSVPVALLRAAALGGIFILDYVQTPILSSLITLIVPAYAESESNARLWASSLFLGLQLAVYAPTLLLGVFALPSTLRLLLIDPLLIDLLVPPLMLIFFALLREMIVIGLWHRVEEQLSTTTVELDAITRRAV